MATLTPQPELFVDVQGRVCWVDCRRCGPQPPRTYTTYRNGLALERPLLALGGSFRCGRCELPASTLRRIRLRAPRPGAAPAQCGAACLNGKVSCDCRCNGRCHGAGVCRC